jgi:hypothetical protein
MTKMNMQKTVPQNLPMTAVSRLVRQEVLKITDSAAAIKDCHEMPGVEDFFYLDSAARERLRIVGDNDYFQIFRLPSNPDFLVRDNFYSLFSEQNGMVCFSPEQIADLLESKKLYDEFGSKVAQVPDFNFVINYGFQDDKSRETPAKGDIPDIFTVVEMVQGCLVGKLLFSAPALSCIRSRYGRNIQTEMDHIVANLIRYEDEKIGSKKKFATEASIRQFMYGNTKNNAEKQIYFVDVDNRFATCDKSSDSFKFSHPPLGKHAPVEGTFGTLYNKIFFDLMVTLRCIEKTDYRADETRAELKKFIRKHEPAHMDKFYRAEKVALGL